MEGWYTLAQTLDNHERRFQAILGNTWNYNYKANHTPAAEPMDVDRVKTATIVESGLVEKPDTLKS